MTDWLHVKVAIYENGLFGVVVAYPPQNCWGKLQVLAIHNVGAELNGFRFYAVLIQLYF